MMSKHMDDEDIETLSVCPDCDGIGEVAASDDDDAYEGEMDECERCEGSGYLPNADDSATR